MSRYGQDFVNTFGTIVSVVAHDRRGWHPSRHVTFAWFSVNQVGDASVDLHDYTRHLIAFEKDAREGGEDLKKPVDA